MMATLLPLVSGVATPVAEAQVCPGGTNATNVTWGAAGGIVWDTSNINSGATQTYPDIGGSGVDMTMTMTDPSNMNEDANNPLVNLPTADGNWDGPFYTQTDGAYGNGYLTFVITSLNSNQVVTMALDFTAPVLLPNFSIGDIDFTGNRAPGNAIPHDSFQDEILLTANRNGTPVGFTGTPGAAGSPVVTLNDAANGMFAVAGGPYSNGVNGNLSPGDAAGTVTLSTLAPVTSLTFGYSNGPDDQAADVVELGLAGGTWPAANYAAPMLNTDVGVSNNHAVRVNVFTVCTGAMSIGDTVYADIDGDGIEDAGDPGIEGVTVTLVGQDGLTLDTTTTDENGEYLFENLPPWDYSVVVSDTPAGWTTTADRDGNNDDNSGVITLTTSNVDDADFGLQPPLGSVAGTVFSDPGNNGLLEPLAGDTPIAGVMVTLNGTDVAGNPINVTVPTDASGNYLFPDVPAGTYTVTEAQPTGFDDGMDIAGTNATNTGNDVHTVTLDFGESSIDNDFAELGSASLAGTVFQDDDNDGEITGTDAGIASATVALTGTDDAGNAVSFTTATGPDGTYLFDNLRPGTYTVSETQPGGYLDGLDDAGTSGGDDSANDVISAVTLAQDTDATEYDFGEILASSISGSVFDQDDAPIPGTTITLTGTDDLGAAVSVSMQTDVNGDYSFTGLRPGTYQVVETQPAGYGDGPDFVGSEGGVDTVNDEFTAITLPPATDAVDYDFSEASSSIAGTVVDDEGNPIPNVTLTLTGTATSGATVSTTTMTDENGDYLFAALESGNYVVTETQPTGYGDGGETAGSTGGDDSVNDVISAIALPLATDSVDNDFDEIRGSISGTVFEDTNNDGAQNGVETGIAGVDVRLTGTDDLGNVIDVTVQTNGDGDYTFPGLLSGTYTVTESQPASHIDGIDTPGSSGGDGSTNDVLSAIALGAGVDATDYDFGEILPASIAGTVFSDPDNNGLQEGAETGIENVTLTLTGTDDLGAAVTETATTDENGDYVFDMLRPGTYTVTETQPADYFDGMDVAGSHGGDDTTTNDQIATIAVASGDEATDYDFGELPPASIAGSVVDDIDNPIEGVTLTLTGTDDLGAAVTETATTDENGDYLFDNLRPGTYTVTETQPTGYGDGGETAGSTGGDDTVDDVISAIPLAAGEDSINNDFDEVTGSLSGSVFEDPNNNGSQDLGELPIEGVSVRLTGTDDLGNVVDRTVMTDENGEYLFDNLISGTYTVNESQPDGYFDGLDTAGSAGGDDSAVNDEISAVAIGAGVDAVDYDFAELPPASIAGNVVDDFGNPIPNVTLTLTGTDDLGATVTTTGTTGEDGEYVFADLRPGTYTVTETQPAGYGDGGETAGSTGGDDSVDDVISSIPLAAGEESINNDFDETTGSLSGSVFEDPNNNGQQEFGEDPIEAVTVQLTGTDVLGNPVDLMTMTDETGSYTFDNLVAGTYVVTETQPIGYFDGVDTAGSEGGTVTGGDEITAITLPAAVDATGYDFGELLASSISGTVFVDDNNDGTQDADEAPIEGVTVALTGTDDLGAAVTATATTGPDGSYTFPGLRPGDYTVTETQPAAYLDGIDTAGSEDGDATVNDVVSSIALPGATDATDYDFGELAPASISGAVVDDFDNPIEDVTLTLTGTDDLGAPVTATTTTNENGEYEFANLRPGDYTVTETQPPGYADGGETAGSTGGDDSVDDVISSIPLAPGDASINNDFDELTGSLAGTVFEDDNNDGVIDPTEAGIEGVSVRLIGNDDLGNPVDLTVTTDEDGNYLFDNLISGDYTIYETQPVGYFDGMDIPGSEGGQGTDNDVIGAVPIGAGVDATDYDFGEVTPSDISGTVEEDRTGDGEPEGPLVGVTVELVTTGGDVVETAVTDENGDFLFESVPPGDYIVRETDPADYDSVSDVEGVNDNEIPVTMAGEDIVDRDFVDEPLADISGTVEEDRTGDGVPEGPLVGVTVELVDENGDVIDTAVTDENGDFLFTDVPPGDYIVRETDPADYGSVSDVEGVNDNEIPVTMIGEDIVDRDFVDEPLADISGTVEEDRTADGVPEGPLAGVTIELIDDMGVVVSATVTDENGDFLFTDVPPGDYIVKETDPADYAPVSDVEGANDNLIPVTMIGEDIVDRDFVDEPLADISGTVEEDNDQDGEPDVPLSAVVVELIDENGDVVDTAVTDENGDFLFTDVPPGDYIVRETDPAAYRPVSDVEGANDNEIPVTMIGEDIVDRDFVDEAVPSSVSGNVFADNDGDDVTDEPLVEIEIQLIDEEGNVVATTTTGPDGSYGFTEVPPGTYTLVEVDPLDYASASDIDEPNDNAIEITVAGGVPVTDQDFVDEPIADISGVVELDSDHDGLTDCSNNATAGTANAQAASSCPIPGVTVELLDSSGNVVATTTTDAGGAYLFADVTPGQYIVREADPNDHASVGDVDGANDNEIPVTMTGDDVRNRNFVDGPVFEISGAVRQDINGDGGGDTPVPGVVVTLSDPDGKVLATTKTGTDGTYTFSSVLPGDYIVTEQDPSNLDSVSDVEGGNDNVISVKITDESAVDQDYVDRVPLIPGKILATSPDPAPSASGQSSTATQPEPRSEPDGPLAFTGRSVKGLTLAGMILVVSGSGVVYVGRRRTEAKLDEAM